jgi:DNA-binding LacI/PurR family transcriptional regulator
VPSEQARVLSTGKKETIAFISTRYESAFISDVLWGIENSSYTKGLYDKGLSVFSTRGLDKEKHELFSRIAHGKLAEAVITLFVAPDKREMSAFNKAGIPVITIEAQAPGAFGLKVDNKGGAYQAVKYLIGKGRRKIALINGEKGYEEVGDTPFERKAGYLQALREAGIKFDPGLEAQVRDYTFDEGRDYMKKLLLSNKKIDAVFCAAGDMCAIGAMEKAAAMGKKIPDDIAVVGFDDMWAAQMAKPALTTVRQPVRYLGEKAFEMAARSIAGEKGLKTQTLITPELIIRQST